MTISKIIKHAVIRKIVWNIVDFGHGFAVVNTHRKENMVDRDNKEESLREFKTLEEAEQFLKNQADIN